MLCRIILISLIILFLGFIQNGWASQKSIEQIGKEAVRKSCERLKISGNEENIACLTNAGYATINGRSTRILFDILSKLMNISIGKGNLLPVHDKLGESLWFGFVAKKSNRQLIMVYVRSTAQGIKSTEATNIYVDKGTSFKPFETLFGRKAFALVTLANGWADGIPEELMTGSLFHDHLCCGVFSGYHTANYIKKQIPLNAGERYIYIGVPAWCQDDYLITTMNLTPGKHGYYTMAYPWSRPWKTDEKTYDKLGGIVIRFSDAAANGWAYLLRFNWRWEEFKAAIGMPDLTLEWEKQPWLHVCYNRFSLKQREHPDYFVSVIKRIKLENKNDLNGLINMGSNPLAQILGPDRTWPQSN
jgi:formylmethanofuran dehydrogenase subunit E-like metal-binding protein